MSTDGGVYMEWVLILISAILSGLVGVGISTWYHQRNEIKRIKLQVLQQLLGNRNDLKGQPFTEALNQVFVVFYDSQVLIVLKAFFEVIVGAHRAEALVDQKLLDLFKAICKHLGITTEPLNDDFFLQTFNVRS
jgi:hypothetical protein